MTNGATTGSSRSRRRDRAEGQRRGGADQGRVIGNKSDLGAVPQLWAKPQTYARFLGAELRFVYKDTLLVVMPQGIGISGPYSQARALAALAGIDARKDTTPKGLTATADSALRALAAADGHKIQQRWRQRRRRAVAVDRRGGDGARGDRRRSAHPARQQQAEPASRARGERAVRLHVCCVVALAVVLTAAPPA